jgi:hypothetical protein
MMMEALRSSETTDLARAVRRNIPEDAILHYEHGFNVEGRVNLPYRVHWSTGSGKET